MLQKNYPWAERFIEIAAKTIYEVHLENKNIEIGFAGITDEFKRLNSNSHKGAEDTFETYVVKCIYRNYINSPLISGIPLNDNPTSRPPIEKGIRYWKIDHEVKYQRSEEKCDLTVRRYLINDNKNEFEVSFDNYNEVYIEAKRAHLNENVTDESQITQIYKDVIKLCRERDHLKESGKAINDYYFHLLIWGFYEPTKKKMNPKTIENKINETIAKDPEKCQMKIPQLSLYQLKWLPIHWKNEFRTTPPEITKYLWVGLYEINFR